jgi:hypothetical protein
VEGEWAGNGDTEQGRRVHAKVDAGKPKLPPPPDDGVAPAAADSFRTSSVELASGRLGLVAKMDLLEGEDGLVAPVDYKKGKRPHVEAGAYEPERVQLCVQALVLEENGYRVKEGFLWFAESRERVPVRFDEELRASTLEAASALRLAGDSALPLYVQQPGAWIGKEGEVLVIKTFVDGTRDEAETRIALGDISELVLAGPVNLSTPARPAGSPSRGPWWRRSSAISAP